MQRIRCAVQFFDQITVDQLFNRQRISGRSGDNLFQRADVCGFGVIVEFHHGVPIIARPGIKRSGIEKKAPPKQASATPSAKAAPLKKLFLSATERNSLQPPRTFDIFSVAATQRSRASAWW
jgi:hypothetical protein